MERGGALRVRLRGDSRGGRAPDRVQRRVRVGTTGGGGLRGVRRTSRHRPCMRPQSHRGVRGRCRDRPGRSRRSAGSHRSVARHAGRGRGRGQGPHAGTGRVRRRARGDDGPPLAGGPARRHLPRGLPLRRDLHRPERSCLGRPLEGDQRGGRDGRLAGRRRPAPPAAPTWRPGARGGARQWRCRERHTREGDRPLHVQVGHTGRAWRSSNRR